ncbi:single-stranded-DNA-specific exonuclease RecJ [Candidatus Daviesbacteria bacterium RIFCSPLOWO2_01_FULL_39_12]|uniref:Single-stranded-DNA-specific exonuclease RecJ n=1 Tax=Candidatus Daviesbacteria bacterium RIFCSPLOWO2_01_FULL_39_12 TaxID=1797785 RepID=A0A1F5KQ44_9BACT|nr:MAG: single-stranded-DNA-specific exonuclease RecJ [Candidatus Daviesbacteria bacterium RIFCSPHIGHO2_02_FULL_39_8]OGE43012.1 MAG: single-stranded-DNA-specific exonuclease RecJ [Candidatus Daviesbacteria bacterium RIFCSPLOWO2_01_FULL_39_12]
MLWKISPKKSDDIIEQLMINRNLTLKEDQEKFFNPKLTCFEKDLDIPGIKKAQQRILKAIKENELILIFGDYDVDGICGSAILYKALTSLGAKVLPYIPHREKEGYGLSKLGLEFARDSGASLVITVDNGIVALNQAEFAKELGLDLIITDHHLPLDKKPDAYETVHSTKMCGAAVGWCLIRDIIKKELAHDLLQFVALATVCDVMPLLELNRAFLVEGLKVLNRTTNFGLLALINQASISLGEISTYEVGHILGPRLNAMGRLEHAIDSLRLLCTKDPQKANRLAKLLSETNTTRQEMTLNSLEQAKTLIDKSKKIHVLAHSEWSAGIIGLIAGRIADEYYRPAIAISIGQEVSKGSARSIDGINIVEVIRKCSDILIDVGGHPGAAGFSIKTKHIEIFKRKVEEYVVDLPQTEPVLQIDAQINVIQITKRLVEQIKKFEPFGFKNPRPVFVTRNPAVSDIRTVGDGKHLKCKVNGFDAIAFGMGEMQNMLQNQRIIDLAFTPEIDTYNGFEKIQLKVKDIKLS